MVAASSYEARKFGIHSAMSAYRAKQLCPHAVFIKPRIDHYASVSINCEDIFEEFTPLIEPLSLDEAFLDVTGCERLLGHCAGDWQKIRSQVHERLHLTASVGVGAEQVHREDCERFEKPNGFVVVQSDQVQSFFRPLPVDEFGELVSYGTSLRRFAIETIGQLRKCRSKRSLICLAPRRTLLETISRNRRPTCRARPRCEIHFERNDLRRRYLRFQ